MPALSAYINTENTALVILEKLGYQYWYDDSNETCCCEKDGWDFVANSFTELLGVVRIYEFHNPDRYEEYWWKIDEPCLVEEVPSLPEKYKSVIYRKREQDI